MTSGLTGGSATRKATAEAVPADLKHCLRHPMQFIMNKEKLDFK
jgi:hypothetical protein